MKKPNSALPRGVKLLSKREMDRAVREMMRKKEKDQRDLEARARPLYELTREELFTVQGVLQESYSHTVSPMSEWRSGSSTGHYHAGYSTRTTLTVKPDNSRVPIKTLIFAGPTALRNGDRISAIIPRYEKHGEERWPSSGCDGMRPRVLYTDRQYKDSEEAVQITTLRSDERGAVRTDRSANYRDFTKE